MAPTQTQSRNMHNMLALPRRRQRRSAATDVHISSSVVTSVVTSTDGTRSLVTGTHDEDDTAKEKTP